MWGDANMSWEGKAQERWRGGRGLTENIKHGIQMGAVSTPTEIHSGAVKKATTKKMTTMGGTHRHSPTSAAGGMKGRMDAK